MNEGYAGSVSRRAVTRAALAEPIDEYHEHWPLEGKKTGNLACGAATYRLRS